MKRENVIFGIVFAVIIVLSILIVWPFISYIVLAGVLTYTLFPVYSFIRRATRQPRISSGAAILVALLLLVLPSFLIAERLAEEVSGAFTSFEVANLERLGDYLSGITGNQFDFQEMLAAFFTQVRASVIGLAPDVLGSLTEMLLGLFIMFFIMYYAFRDGEGFLQHVKQILPLEPVLKDKLFREVRNVTQAVLYGQVMTAVIQGAIATLGLVIFGVANWVFWGLIMTILAFLPVFGTPIIWVPAAVDLILQGDTFSGIGLLVYGILIVTNVDNLVRPRLVSERSQVHPALIIVGVLGGLKVIGFSGMLVGPLILALLVALVQFWEDVYIDKKIAA